MQIRASILLYERGAVLVYKKWSNYALYSNMKHHVLDWEENPIINERL